MRKALFYILYVLSPSVPAALYAKATAGGSFAYSLSVTLGVSTLVFLLNQFILASKPSFVLKALGAKSLIRLHGVMPLLILAMALAHRTLKASMGFPLSSFQAILGTAAWILVAIGAVLALALMMPLGDKAMAKVRTLRERAKAKLGLDYKRSRTFHNLMVAAALALMSHALIASTASFAYNAIGALWLILWAAFSLGLYVAYRLRGRKNAQQAGARQDPIA